jgi:hypothetical protein
MSENNGIVYVLTNPAMPGIVKIGKTAREGVETRLNELYSTGVPLPFECAYAAKVKNETQVEQAFHKAFAPNRINAKREFFEIEAEQAIALLSLMAVENVTPQIQEEAKNIDAGTQSAANRLKSRRPNMNFIEMNIPVGSSIIFIETNEAAEVISEKKVKYQDEEFSLTGLTRKLFNLDYSIQPSWHWTFNGKTLADIYNETYEVN